MPCQNQTQKCVKCILINNTIMYRNMLYQKVVIRCQKDNGTIAVRQRHLSCRILVIVVDEREAPARKQKGARCIKLSIELRTVSKKRQFLKIKFKLKIPLAGNVLCLCQTILKP